MGRDEGETVEKLVKPLTGLQDFFKFILHPENLVILSNKTMD